VSDTFPLWTFTLEVYKRSGVEDLCLRLQDVHGLDISVLLAGAWIGATGRVLVDEEIEALLDDSDAARQRVQRLRSIRRAVRPRRAEAEYGELYRALKRAELAAEKVVSRQLFDWIEAHAGPAGGPSLAFARATMRAYAEVEGAWPEAASTLEALVERTQPTQ
jgi:uncharacterized protein (TIGR02444 family)